MCCIKRFFFLFIIIFTYIGLSSSFTTAQDFSGSFVNRIRITLDQSEMNNWNEIDAVELVGRDAGGSLIRQWAMSAEASSAYGADSWSPAQATGEPDVFVCGDSGKAWASKETNKQEWLLLTYATPVAFTEVIIHQTNSPGAIILVEALPADNGAPLPLFAGPDMPRGCPGALRIVAERAGVSDAVPVYGVRVAVNQMDFWSEIDAVELVGITADGIVLHQWAAVAEATSQYGIESWSAAQATDEQNTFSCGDSGMAWASLKDEDKAAVTLLYETPVVPLEVNVYQSYNPGNVTWVELLSTDQQTRIFNITNLPSGFCPAVLNLNTVSGETASLPTFWTVNETVAHSAEGIGKALSFGYSPIQYGETVTGTITTVAGINHHFQEWVFIGQVDDIVDISMTASTATLDPYVLLLDSAGNIVAADDDTGDSLNARIEGFVLSGHGLYTIRATGFGGSMGAFQLNLNKQ